MRVKKQKTNRRTIRFYKTRCGFREPFKVLCDGTFLHYLLSHKMGPPADHLSRLLFGSSRPFTTRCVIAELKKLGEAYFEAVSVARKLDAAKCNHDPLKSASDCLESLVGDGNPEHFFVATQDADLRMKLRQAPAVGIILAQNNFLVLEPPSEKQQAIAHANEANRTHASKREFEIIEARERKKEALLAAQSGEDFDAIATNKTNRGLDTFKADSDTTARRRKSNFAVDHARFKKKRAKKDGHDCHDCFLVCMRCRSRMGTMFRGLRSEEAPPQQGEGPNPLSCKKKIKKPTKTETQVQRLVGDGDAGGTPKGNRGHRRKKAPSQ